MTAATLREHLREGPFHLSLSSGFFGFFAHAGVLTVLEDEGLLPASLSGSSAGALVAGVWASGVSATEIRDTLLALQRSDFWDPALGFGLLRGRLFRKRLSTVLAVKRIEHTRTPLAISVYDVFARRTRALERGDLARAICASCAVPGMFHPVWIDGRPFYDGGVLDRPGLHGVGSTLPILLNHLPSSSGLQARSKLPARTDVTTLAIGGLPAVGPFKLHHGPRAFEHAAKAARAALGRRIDRRLVAV